MQKLTKINPYPPILVSSSVISCEKPDYVYIPLPKNAKLLLKEGMVVSIGTPLFKTDSSIITSPISGLFSTYKKIDTKHGLMNSLEITNDYQETKVIDPILKNNYNNIKKEKLANLLKTYFKINMEEKENLILNCIDDEPYILTESFYLFLYYEGFLELLDKLAHIFNFKNIIICLKSTNSENINKLMECLGMYPNIKLNITPNLYLLGKTNILLNYLGLNNAKSVSIKASNFYNIYNLILRNRQISDKLITISGDGISNPSIIRTKIGTPLKDIINSVIKLKKDNLDFFAEGLMSGRLINIDNFIITDDLSGIIINKHKETPKESKCINCGACLNICPVNLNPLLLSNPSYFNKVKDICLKCGLCTYICPSYINFNKFKGEDHE